LRTEGDGEETFEVECAFSPERMKPLEYRAFEGRANPKGIPYLYVATSIKTGVGECRPWVGALVSVSQVQTSRDLRIVNCTSEEKGGLIFFKEPPPEQREEAVWRDIDRAFAEPVTRADDTADYAPTQILAELFRESGLDGIGYRSALGTGHNLALFDLDSADVINGQLVKVDSLDIVYSQADNPYVVSRFYDKTADPENAAANKVGGRNRSGEDARDGDTL
jgi:RES domain-containing protein